MKNRSLNWLAAGAIFTVWIAQRAYYGGIEPRSSRMIPDHQGNYDLDGVSFDPKLQRVTVSGDAIRADSVVASQHSA